MFSNYIKLALRNMAKNRLYALINIVGLAIGLTVFLFSSILVHYERNHDSMFAKRDRIFTAGSVFSADADISVLETDSMYTGMAPLVRNELQELEAVARTVDREFLVAVGEGTDSYYQGLTFADPDMLEIFDFDYLYGDRNALADVTGIVLSESIARKYFGRTDVLGEVVTLDHKYDLQVKAVIADVPADSHFKSSLFGEGQALVLAPLAVLESIENRKFDDNWNNLSLGDLTYMLLPEDKDQQWLAQTLNAIYQRHAPKDQLEFIPMLRVRPLVEANTMIWDAMGIPVINTVRLLGLLILIIACVNYTNLATAQSMGRTREVGLRKTFGASRKQLLAQFMLESLTTVLLSLLLAVAMLELLIPAFNQATDKALSLHYAALAPFLLLTVLAVAAASGIYPALMITRASPIDSLRNSVLRGGGGSLFRSVMIGGQFAISIFMLALVMVMYFQNKLVEESSNIFPKSTVVVLDRVGVEDIQRRHEILRRELLALPGVESVSYSSQVPFEQSTSTREVARAKGDKASSLMIDVVAIDEGFLATYDIPMIAGRELSRGIATDVVIDEPEQVSVVVNQLAVKSLGFASNREALGQSYFRIRGERDEGAATQFTIVGVVADRNFLGLQNRVKPMAFSLEPADLRKASIRLRGGDLKRTLQDIEKVWDRVNPDYPIQLSFLDEVFGEIYSVFTAMNMVLAGFALVALALALIGLFGLAAFMAERRTREIGIRKVLGARVGQIARLLVWQFSTPVLWSLLVAMPAAWFASGLYLGYFSQRIEALAVIILLASTAGLLAAWCIVAGHAIRIANASPIHSLRYE